MNGYDEAARVNPLDLMIVIAQGKRIILVGDHRQLPQLIDHQIENRLQEAESLSNNATDPNTVKHSTVEDAHTTDWLKRSLFEHLFKHRLPNLEKQDGIKRHITLAIQYRMPKTLGDFIAENFYPEDEQFASGGESSWFVHDIPWAKGCCAGWLDVPYCAGKTTKEGTSLVREAEVEIIHAKVSELLESTELAQTALSIGIISFYRGQAENLREKFGNDFINQVNRDNGHRYKECLRIGTVDAFQGMEFDVVFLSLARTASPTEVAEFGFLRLENRLNVGMSRAKKLLVLVGDYDFFHREEAKTTVPALYNFADSCRGPQRREGFFYEKSI